tara:strand:+ start:760 stop:939 length:180 start_codon:yes stop_codon:yes gene_type:complete
MVFVNECYHIGWSFLAFFVYTYSIEFREHPYCCVDTKVYDSNDDEFDVTDVKHNDLIFN